jgi:dimethylhistidine N-methyltransferase
VIPDSVLREGLLSTPKRLPAALLYDELGSTLFEAITLLPEYPLARIGMRLLLEHRSEVLAFADEIDVVELGPGSGKMALSLLEALATRQRNIRFAAVDVSEQALESSARTLARASGVQLTTVHADYLTGLRQVAVQRSQGVHLLVLFLGSNLSNFERSEASAFLGDVRGALCEGDALLLSVDLDKPPAELLAAYDDALGVTAAFNKNVLLRMNREWGANFPLEAFAHQCSWNSEQRRVEMHLVATSQCLVSIPRLDCELYFPRGESLWTESSHRFSLDEIVDWAAAARFHLAQAWTDRDWPFAQLLLLAR